MWRNYTSSPIAHNRPKPHVKSRCRRPTCQQTGNAPLVGLLINYLDTHGGLRTVSLKVFFYQRGIENVASCLIWPMLWTEMDRPTTSSVVRYNSTVLCYHGLHDFMVFISEPIIYIRPTPDK